MIGHCLCGYKVTFKEIILRTVIYTEDPETGDERELLGDTKLYQCPLCGTLKGEEKQ